MSFGITRSAGRGSGVLMITVLLILISMLGGFGSVSAHAPEMTRADDLILGIELDHDSVFNTSAGGEIGVSYSLSGRLLGSIHSGDLAFNHVVINMSRTDRHDRPITVYTWAHTHHDTIPDDPMYFMLPTDLPAGNYSVSVYFTLINLSAIPYDNITEEETSRLVLLDGTDFYWMAGFDPYMVDNSGSGEVTVTYESTREITGHYSMHLGLFNDDLGSWESPRVADPLGNVTYDRASGISRISVVLGIGADIPTGMYSIRSVLSDPWGYSEALNESAFKVILEPMPPTLLNDTIYMMEDEPLSIDLRDRFSDPNGDDLEFLIDSQGSLNISVIFQNDTHIKLTPALDWFGEDVMEIWVNDGAGHNISFDIEIIVVSVEDLPRPVEGRTLLVNENRRYLEFDPLSLFHDPDINDTFEVSLGWKWVMTENGTNQMERMNHWTDDTFVVSLISLIGWNPTILILRDIEEGTAEFPLTAWVDETTFVNSTGQIEVAPVNDPPRSMISEFTGDINEPMIVHLRDLFSDPDNTSDELSFSITEFGPWIDVSLDSANMTIEPFQNWTGSTWVRINVSDGIDHSIFNLTVIISENDHIVNGSIVYQDGDIHLADAVEWEFQAELTFTSLSEMSHISVDPSDGSFLTELPEGIYTVYVGLNLDWSRYHSPGIRSGYDIPDYFDLILTEDMSLEITIRWIDIDEGMAAWGDIDFSNHTISLDDDSTDIFVPVTDLSLDGFDEITVNIIIGDGEDQAVFQMEWKEDLGGYHLILRDDDLEEIDEHEMDYHFSDPSGTDRSSDFTHEFREDDDEKGGIIGLLIFLFLFFMFLLGVIVALIAAFIGGVVLAIILAVIGIVLIVGLILITLLITAVIGLVIFMIPVLIILALIIIPLVLLIGIIGLLLFIGLILSIVTVVGVLLFGLLLIPIVLFLLLGGIILTLVVGLIALIGTILAVALSIIIPIVITLLIVVGIVISIIVAVAAAVIISIVIAIALIVMIVLAFILYLLFVLLVFLIALPIIAIVEIVRLMRRKEPEEFEE